MKLQDRNLSLRMRGEDVALLHKELQQLEYAIAENELQRKYFGTTTRQAVLDFQKKQDLEGSGIVDKETAKRINEVLESGDLEYRVKGTVSLADRTPAPGLGVSVFDRDLRSEQLLGKHRIDREGFYKITYYARQFRRLEKGSADLVVKVFADDGELLAVSQTLFNAPRDAELDLTIPADVIQPLTLFEKIGRAIVPLLDDLKIEGLEESQQHQDVTFLGGETGFEINDIARFVMAHKLAMQAIQPEFWFALLGGSFNQFTEDESLKDRLSEILDELPSLDAAAVRKALIRGFNLKEIPETLREKVAEWVEAFLRFIASRSV